MTMTAGQLGATQLLAQMLATIDDPHEHGVGIDDLTGHDNTVTSTVLMPSGDQYRVTIEWLGDREALA